MLRYFTKSGLALLALAFTLSSCDQLAQIAKQIPTTMGPPTETEITGALRDALSVGIRNAVTKTSQTDGFYGNSLLRIQFPPEAKQVETTLRGLGMNKIVDDFIVSMNRGAEQASKKATDVFLASIRQMTITDGYNIWKGNNDAATQFLRRTSTDRLRAEFRPIVQQALQQVEVTKFWTPVVSAYNKIPLTKPVNPNLEEYVTNQAIDGLFKMVAEEELKIRQNPAARTTALLQRVFGYQG
jgi:hypothetical protein